MVHWQHGFFMNWFGQQAGEGYEYHLLAMGLCLSLFMTGGGKFSVDAVIARRLKSSSVSEA
jgi:putative oxidoreductase